MTCPVAPERWPRVEVRELSIDRGLVGGPFGSSLGRKDYRPAGVPVIRGTNLADGSSFSAENFVYVSEAKADELRRNLAIPGDLVFTQRGTLGQVGIVPEGPFARYVISQSQMRLRCDTSKSTPRFLYSVFRSPLMVEQILSRAITTGVPHINLRILGDLELLLPPLAEQRGIAVTLGALDDKIDSNRRKISVLHALAASVCQSILDSPTERWSEAWPDGRLDDVLAILEVGRRPAGGIKPEPHGVPSIGAESIVQAGSFDFSKTKRVSEAFFAGMRRGHLEHLDVLLYKDGGTPGNFIPHVSAVGHGFPFEAAAINEHVYRLRITPPYSQSFLYFWLSMPRLLAEMRRRGTGAAIPGLNSSAVRDLPVLQPPPQLLSKLQDVLDPLLDLILRSAKESRACAQLRDALLPELLSGRLRVPEASEAVDDVLA